MTTSVPGSFGRIFVSYRRDDAAFPASWLFERLANRFGESQVFKDISSIQLGDDFIEEIAAAVGSCAVLLAVIGDRWLTITDSDGRRRIDDPEDLVRLEIETALKRNVRVIPVLVGGAQMPRQGQLPDTLASLARRQALELNPGRFDTSQLEAQLAQALTWPAVTDKATGSCDQAEGGLPSQDSRQASQAESVTSEREPERHSEPRWVREEQRPRHSSPAAGGRLPQASDAAQPTWPYELRSVPVALAGRAAQRDFVDNLAVTWRQLADSWASLVTSAADLANAAVRARPPDSAQLSVLHDLTMYLAASASWRERATSVSALIDEMNGSVRALHQRVHRETVNIGVIGTTGAGKSTLFRRLSGLQEDYLPSNQFSSTTATPNRIFHEPGAGRGRAVLHLHTWESFRAEVLVPLHRRAEITGPPPLSLEDFRRFQYEDDAAAIPAGHARAERYRRRLRLAQASLPSYQGFLQGGTREITLDRLRPFVAYPADGDRRPYHGVRSVDILCEFPQAGVVRLGLIDLPGAGEAGLDVRGRFLADLCNNIDLLFIVTRPAKAPVTELDWDVLSLADDAAAGVRRSDFTYQIINRDASVPDEYFDRAGPGQG